MREHVAISLLGRRRVDRDVLLTKERTMRDVVSLQILEELPGRFFFYLFHMAPEGSYIRQKL